MKTKVRVNVVQAKDCFDPADYVSVHKDWLAHLEAEIRHLGEIADVCTFHTLKTVCVGCRCNRQPDKPSD